jgi:hypothetical protein
METIRNSEASLRESMVHLLKIVDINLVTPAVSSFSSPVVAQLNSRGCYAPRRLPRP